MIGAKSPMRSSKQKYVMVSRLVISDSSKASQPILVMEMSGRHHFCMTIIETSAWM
jgi:hypothetical protein